MRTLAVLILAFVSCTAFAQTNVRVRGSITALNGDVLTVKSRDGRDIQLHLTPDAQVVTAKKTTLAEMGPNAYVGVTSVKGPDGRMVAKEVHAIGPQVPQMHGAWDSTPNSDRKSTRLNSSHQIISYAVFCLKKKKNNYRYMHEHNNRRPSPQHLLEYRKI